MNIFHTFNELFFVRFMCIILLELDILTNDNNNERERERERERVQCSM
jgi:hypothetical protein